MMRLKLCSLISLFIFLYAHASPGQGTIRGTVIDDETGEALIGATVVIAGTTKGASTDLDGKFAIQNVAAGAHTLHCSYVSYQLQQIRQVEVRDSEVAVLNIRLKPESIGLNEVVVSAAALRDNEAAILTMQKRSGLVMDGISSAQFAKTGDSDAASAIKRVTGISVEGGKYVYVRGLGDRYSKTTLNSAEIPGLDPNRNTVQMDIFPSNLIENMVVYKTFSPELPGSFSGGFVNIKSKEFPDRFTLQLSASAAHNSNATLADNVISHDLGSGHAFALAPEARNIPEAAQGEIAQRYQNDLLLDRQTKAFNNDFSPRFYSPFFDHKFSFSIGDQKELLGKKFGFIAGLRYQRNYEHYDNGRLGRYLLPGSVEEAELQPVYLYDTDVRSADNVLIGGLANLSFQLNHAHKLGFNVIRNQSASGTTRYLQGLFPYASGGDPNFFIENRSMEYQRRLFTSYQLKGAHAVGERNIKVDWIGSYTVSQQDEPDLRYFNNLKFRTENGEGEDAYTYSTGSGNIRPASHYFRNLDETNYDAKVNIEIPVGSDAKIKLGGSYVAKERNFTERIIQYRVTPEAKRYDGDIDAYFDESNLGIIGQNDVGNNLFGLYVRDETSAGGSYTGTQSLPAAYGMADVRIGETFKIVAGARLEATDIKIVNENASEIHREGAVATHDILPAVNITKNLSEMMNLRLGYGRTVARPTFRELARFHSFDFQGDFILIGNPSLERTMIENVDLRWEVFPRPGEIVSFSAFYKKFDGPIERAVDPNTNDIALQVVFRNVPEAYLYGAEFELRKSLEFIAPLLSDFSIGGNFTYVFSRVDIPEGELKLIRVNNPDAGSVRPMFGQSPYIINAYLNYNNSDSRTNFNLSYNVSGERLSVVSTGGTPNVYEQPRPQLDLKLMKGLTERFSIDFSAKNLLDSPHELTQEFKGKTYAYQSYNAGRTFSIGLSYKL